MEYLNAERFSENPFQALARIPSLFPYLLLRDAHGELEALITLQDNQRHLLCN
jgi:hypothetical protein